MNIEAFSNIRGKRQDGAISNGFLFSFDDKGVCTVYDMNSLKENKNGETEIFAEFVVDKNDVLMPHSNSVVFGSEYYDEKDEFPLLYTNIYNNYADSDELTGVCLVYRLHRNDKEFKATLVQMIKIGFTEDKNLWKSMGEKEDARPYGNFVIDTEKGIFYAFTMRDNTNSTRYFSFALPKVEDGEMCEKYGVKKVVLTESDIIKYFDCDYHLYIQGATCHGDKIYSLEGFTDSLDFPPAIRVIDTNLNKEIVYKQFKDFGTNIESEMIDFEDDTCYYSDHDGHIYKLSF